MNIGFDLFSLFNRDTNQLTHPIRVHRYKWVMGQQSFFEIFVEETAGIVPAEPESGLGQIVGSEGKEICLHRNFIRHQSCPGKLDHATNFIIQRHTGFLNHFFCHFHDEFTHNFEFIYMRDKRYHDFRKNFNASFDQLAGRFHNGPDLHPVNIRKSNSKPATPMPKHGVNFFHIFDFFPQSPRGYFHFFRQVFYFRRRIRQEFMQRGIQ